VTQAVVFLGPTLPAEQAAAFSFRVLPPARQGDVYRAVRAWRPAAVGIVDGLFLDVPAVWHREILWALAQGVHVYGAASMGALRAAELECFGMRGVGRIFEAYQTGVWPGFPEKFEDDDEVAVVHAPVEAGGAALSEAMVDVRATLLAAHAASVIGRRTCLRLAAAMKRRHFAERSFAALVSAAPSGLRDWLPTGRVAQKRLDALAMLEAMRAARPHWGEPFAPKFRFERALVWQRFEAAAHAAEQRARAAAVGRLRGGVPLLRKEDVDEWLG